MKQLNTQEFIERNSKIEFWTTIDKKDYTEIYFQPISEWELNSGIILYDKCMDSFFYGEQDLYICQVEPAERSDIYDNGVNYITNMVKVKNKILISELINKNSLLSMNILRKNGRLLKYIREQTEELCQIACSENGLALEYVKNKSIFVCYIACRENVNAYQYLEYTAKSLINLFIDR